MILRLLLALNFVLAAALWTQVNAQAELNAPTPSDAAFQQQIRWLLDQRVGNRTENVLNHAHSTGKLSRLTRASWLEMQRNLESAQASKEKGIRSKTPPTNIPGAQAIVEFALGNDQRATEVIRGLPRSSEVAMTLASNWIKHVDQNAANRCVRIAIEDLAKMPRQSRMETLRDVSQFAYDNPQTFKTIWNNQDLDRVMSLLKPRQVAELFWVCGPLFQDSQTIAAKGKQWLAKTKDDDQRLLIGVRMLQATDSHERMKVILEDLQLEKMTLKSNDLSEQQAMATALMYSGRVAINENRLPDGIELLSASKEKYDEVLAGLNRESFEVRFRWKRFRANVDQYLAVTSYLKSDYKTAEASFKDVITAVQKLRQEMRADRMSRKATRQYSVVLDQIQYASSVGLTQIYLKQLEPGKASGVIKDMGVFHKEVRESLSIGLQLQHAKNEISTGRSDFNQLAQINQGQSSGFDGPPSEEQQNVQKQFSSALDTADRLLTTSQEDMKPVERAWATELRGVAAFHLLPFATADQEELEAVALQNDLEAAVDFYQTTPGYEIRACVPLIYLSQLDSAIGNDNAMKRLQMAFDLAEAAGQERLTIGVLTRRSEVKYQNDDTEGFHADLLEARQRITSLASKHAPGFFFDWTALYEAFDKAVAAHLQQPSKPALVDAIAIMWQADHLADQIDSGIATPGSQPDFRSLAARWVEDRLKAPACTLLYRTAATKTYLIAIGKQSSPDGFTVTTLPLSRKELLSRIEPVLKRVSTRPNAAVDDVEKLHQDLAKLRTDLLPDPHVVDADITYDLVRHGVLARLPFHVLFADQDKLPKFRSRLWPSVIETDRTTPAAKEALRYVGIGIRYFGKSTENTLLNAETEVSQFAKHFAEPRIRLGTQQDATWSRLIRDVDWCNGDQTPFVLHLATHGGNENDLPSLRFLDEQYPVKSKSVYAQQIAKQDFRFCQLAILSSCRSDFLKSDHDHVYGNGTSVASAFLQAGAKEAVASSWEVDDEAAALVMAAFGDEMFKLSRDGSIEAVSSTDALQTAMLSVRRQDRFSHPYYWAPFMVLGH